MEVLSEHNCHGWLEGYTLTGRHGWFATYEAFAMVSASQTIQHSKWLQEADSLPWRAAGAEPQRAAHLDRVAQRPQRLQPPGAGPDPERDHHARQHRPGLPAARTPTACSRWPTTASARASYVNLVVIDKQPQLQWLTMDEAIEHCARGAGVWEWAGTDDGSADPDIVLACAGDVVTMETVAAAADPARAPAALPDPGGQRRRPDDAAAPQGPPARHGRDALQRAVHRPRRRGVRLPRLPRRDPPAGARPTRTPTGSGSAASSRRARPRRRSTWWCATGPRATTW